MSVWERVAAQFGRPSGFLGAIAGLIMANRSSNRERIEWGISLLDIRPTDRVLEIGFGPGVGAQRMCGLVTEGVIYGVDHSELMVRKASDRNRNAIESGKVRLMLASVDDLRPFDHPIDKVIDINTFQFWDDPVTSLQAVKKVMAPGGIIALVHQPRKPGATDQDATAAGDRFAGCLEKAQFADIRIEQRLMKPVSTVGVLGANR